MKFGKKFVKKFAGRTAWPAVPGGRACDDGCACYDGWARYVGWALSDVTVMSARP